MSKALIEVKGIKKSFKNKVVHKGVNLKIFDGEKLAIIGPNGAGKTVLLKIIVGLIEQDEGQIINNIKDEPENEIAIQFQENNLDVGMKTKELIEFVKILHQDKIIEEEVEELIKLFGIDDFLKVKTNKLSGGQKQRLNLLLAVIRNTKILILDEFVTGLDISITKKIINHIDNIYKEKNLTLVIVTHQPEELRNLSERMVLLKDGKIRGEFMTKDIEKKYKGNFSKFLFEQID